MLTSALLFFFFFLSPLSPVAIPNSPGVTTWLLQADMRDVLPLIVADCLLPLM